MTLFSLPDFSKDIAAFLAELKAIRTLLETLVALEESKK